MLGRVLIEYPASLLSGDLNHASDSREGWLAILEVSCLPLNLEV